MAEKIETYKASNLALRPSNVGAEAHEQAGRRIGPFAEQAAHAVEQVAALSAKVVEEAGQQQTAFARFEGLEDKGAGAAVKYGGGLKDMFQLGAGGNEPDYARLNRMAELQDGTLSIARAAQHIVRAQSPITHDLSPEQAWQQVQMGRGLTDPEWEKLNASAFGKKQDTYESTGYAQGYGGKDGFEKNPNGEPSYKDFQKQLQKDWAEDDSPWSTSQFGPSMVGQNSKGVATGGNVGGSGGDWTPATGTFNPVTGATNPAAPSNWGNAPADATDPGDLPGADQAAPPVPPPTNSTVWPTTPDQDAPNQPVTPAANPAAPQFWTDLSGGM